jgi:hypothetical protein
MNPLLASFVDLAPEPSPISTLADSAGLIILGVVVVVVIVVVLVIIRRRRRSKWSPSSAL